MERGHIERRRAARRTIAADEPLAHARLRTGGQLTLLDASSVGALAETTQRLLPGRPVDVHIVTAAGRVLVRTRIARAFVSRLEATAIRYRAALTFEQPIDATAIAPRAALAATPPGTPMPEGERPLQSDIVFAERVAR